MNRRAIVAVVVLLLILVPVVYAASLEHISSDQSTNFDRLTAQTDINNTSSKFILEKQSGSRDSFFNNQLKKTSGDLDVSNDRILVGKAWNRLDQITSASESGLRQQWTKASDGAYYNGNHYFLDGAGNTLKDTKLRRWDENGLTQLATRDFVWHGAANHKGDKILFGRNPPSGTNTVYLSYDVSSGSFGTETSMSTADVEMGGIAPAGNGNVYLLFGGPNSQTTLYLDTSPNDGNSNSVFSQSTVAGVGDPAGFAVNLNTDRFYTFDSSDNELVVFNINGNRIASKNMGSGWTFSAVDEGQGEDFNNGKVILYNQNSQEVRELATEDLTHDFVHTWTSKSFQLAPEGEEISNIDVSFQAPQLWGNYLVELQKKEADESSWSTLGSKSGDGQMSFSGSSFNVDSTGVQFRLRMDPGQHHGLSGQVKVTDFNFDYSYYPPTGQVLGHAENNSDIGVDLGPATEINYFNFSGVSPSNSHVDLSVVNKNGTTVHSASSVIGKNINVTGSGINESRYENQRLSLELDYSSEGLQTAELTGFDIAYEPRPPAPEITDWWSNVSTGNETSTSVQTGTGADNTFVIQDINQSVEYIDWYVDGDVVKHQSVSGDGPYSFSTSWEDDGSRTVRGEVYNLDSGSDSVLWNVDVYYLIIGGKSSFSMGPQSSFETTQRFEVFNVQNANVNYSLEYNSSVLKLLSGSTGGNIFTGNSLTWEFLVQGNVSDYNGQPITIHADYNNWSVTKDITVSVGESGGVIVGPGGPDISFGNLLSNTWVELVVQGLADDTYIAIQGILAFGVLAAIWLHHFGIAPMPPFVGGPLDELQFWTKGLVSFNVFILVLGVAIVPVVVLSVLGSAGVWWFWLRNGQFSLLDEVAEI